jgi:methyl-accepting chemotaxis protein
VEEQGAATSEIARNVAETASAANEMANRTTEVSAEAEQTGKHAVEVRENAAGLNAAMGELRHSVIRVVRTATTEVDRRKAVRYQVNLPCRVSIPARAPYSACVTDISKGGAGVRGGPLLPMDTRGSLNLDGVGFALPFSVRATGDDVVHVLFDLDEATATAFGSIVERLAHRQAA